MRTTNYQVYTVQELIEELSKLSGDKPVQILMQDDSNGYASSFLLRQPVQSHEDDSVILQSYLENYNETTTT